MIETFAALGEANRFRIVELLRGGAFSVNEIGERLALNQPQVSKHLRVLKQAGLEAVTVAFWLLGMEAAADAVPVTRRKHNQKRTKEIADGRRKRG